MRSTGAMGSLTPLIPTGGGNTGLVEKRISAFSPLELSNNASFVGEFDRSASSALLLDYDVDGHLNHSGDPATDTLSLNSAASQVMDKSRGVTSNLSLTDTAHVALDGYHPNAGEDLSAHYVTANESVVIGQPVYVSSSNTVNLADASSVNTSKVVGLTSTPASANGTTILLTEGSVNQADWTAVTGTANLAPGSVYFLGTTAGKMTTTPPTGDGEVVVTLGTAITTKKFDIEVNEVAIL